MDFNPHTREAMLVSFICEAPEEAPLVDIYDDGKTMIVRSCGEKVHRTGKAKGKKKRLKRRRGIKLRCR